MWKLGRFQRWCVEPPAVGVVREEVSGSCLGVLVRVAGGESSPWGWVPCMRRCRKCSSRRITGLKLVWEKREMRHVGLRAWFKADKGALEPKKRSPLTTVRSRAIFSLKQAR